MILIAGRPASLTAALALLRRWYGVAPGQPVLSFERQNQLTTVWTVR